MNQSTPKHSQLVDTHCHLDFEPLARDAEAVMQRALDRGVQRVVVPSYDRASWTVVRRLSRLCGVFPAFGLHPWAAGEGLNGAALAAELAAGAVAVGEIGLDTKVEYPPLSRQTEVFKAQLDLAQRFQLPVILHCRGAFELLFEILEQRPHPLHGVLHAFSRGPQLASRAIASGLLLGIGGAVTRTRATRLQRSLHAVGLQHLVLETDAPAIGLAGVDAADTEPAHVRCIAMALASHTRSTLEEVAQTTTANAERLFAGLVTSAAR